MFGHDDEHFDDAEDQEPSATEANAEDEWEPAVPHWRNRIADAAEQDSETLSTPASARGRGTSIISLGTSINGTLRSEDPLYIEGEFEGEIAASGDVTIARGAQVNARIQAIRLTVAGKLNGVVACTDRFEALESGEIAAQVLSPVFVIHEGATINGSLKMRLDDEDEIDLSVPEDDGETTEDQ